MSEENIQPRSFVDEFPKIVASTEQGYSIVVFCVTCDAVIYQSSKDAPFSDHVAKTTVNAHTNAFQNHHEVCTYIEGMRDNGTRFMSDEDDLPIPLSLTDLEIEGL